MFSHSDEAEMKRLCDKYETEGLWKEEVDKLVNLFKRYYKEAGRQLADMRGF